MSIRAIHSGLYFTTEQIESIRMELTSDPILKDAYGRLCELGSGDGQNGIGDTLANALIYKLDGDQSAGERVISHFPILLDRPVRANTVGAACDTAELLHIFELIRQHPAIAADNQGIIQQLEARIDALELRVDRNRYVELIWLACLHLLGGIVLEREAWLTSGAKTFHQAVDQEIRPQGFITRAVETADGENDPQPAFTRQVLSVKALVLMAEAASASANLDLWRYNMRGVSVTTAALYPIYYFYTTEKWKWDESLSVETAQAVFRQHGGWLEMVQRQVRHKDLAVLLDDLRPIYDPSGGGMTTLTHGVSLKQKRRGLFG